MTTEIEVAAIKAALRGAQAANDELRAEILRLWKILRGVHNEDRLRESEVFKDILADIRAKDGETPINRG